VQKQKGTIPTIVDQSRNEIVGLDRLAHALSQALIASQGTFERR
jgi:hypothetical protein